MVYTAHTNQQPVTEHKLSSSSDSVSKQVYQWMNDTNMNKSMMIKQWMRVIHW